MHDLHLLQDLLILVASAVAVVAVAERMRIPSAAGFMLAGVLIGPNALGLVGQIETVNQLAEIGVVLLLFEIGLELSIARIRRVWKAVVLGGGLQVTITLAATAGIALIAGLGGELAIVFGALVALSSTAVVLKTLKDRRELETTHGRVALGFLLFQDLAVVPLMVVVSLMGTEAGATVTLIAQRIGISLGLLAVLLVAARYVVPAVLVRVAGLQNRELFTLTVGLVGFGAAYLTATVGLAMSLGAFVAGLVISESEYGAQALSDVVPFRALFSGIFFTSIGMLLDPRFVVENVGMVASWSGAVIIGKALIVLIVAMLALRRDPATSLIAAFSLAQVGEFSFVLAGVASANAVLDPSNYQLFLAVAVVSMLMTPVLIGWAPGVAKHFSRRMSSRFSDVSDDVLDESLTDHAIIVGYGMAGQHLARVLKAAHVPYVALDLDGKLVREQRRAGESIAYGDGTSREVLERAGVEHARVVVFLIHSPLDEVRGVATVRQLNPSAKIVVRTHTATTTTDLEPLGVTDVIVEEYEATLELFQRIMRHYQIPVNTIQAELDAMRSKGYGILRGLPKEELNLQDLRFLGIHHSLEMVAVEENSQAIGGSPISLNLRKTLHVTVVAVVRDGVSVYEFEDDFGFKPDDVVVLVGPGPALARATAFFCAPAGEVAPGDQPSSESASAR